MVPITFLLFLSLAATRPDLIACARKGETLSDDQANKLQIDLQKSPDDAELRARLLGYDQSRKADVRQARLGNILWMIEHRTTDPISGSPYCQINAGDDPEAYGRGKAAWDAQVTAHPADTTIAANAAAFYAANDFDAAESLLQQTIALEPKNPDWPERLAQLYEKHFTQHPDQTARLAPLSLQLRQSAYNLTPSPSHRFGVLVQMPQDALRGGDLIEAKRYAKQLLATTAKFKTDPAVGDALHWSNITLGEISLRENKLDEADDYLTAAGQTPGSDQLASTGPDFTLAKELLAKGEHTCVHDYLTACQKFWPAGAQRLKSWITTLDAGGTPEM